MFGICCGISRDYLIAGRNSKKSQMMNWQLLIDGSQLQVKDRATLMASDRDKG